VTFKKNKRLLRDHLLFLLTMLTLRGLNERLINLVNNNYSTYCSCLVL